MNERRGNTCHVDSNPQEMASGRPDHGAEIAAHFVGGQIHAKGNLCASGIARPRDDYRYVCPIELLLR
jgi:hypothetical protein